MTSTSFKTLTLAQREAVATALGKYEKNLEEEPITDEDIENWSYWAQDRGLSQCLETLGGFYKSQGDKNYYLKGLDVLRVFYPEVDSPLFEAMREDEEL